LRALARVATTLAFVATYITLHLGVTAAMEWQESQRLRHGLDHATAFAAALDRFLDGDRSAGETVLAEGRWFDGDTLRMYAPGWVSITVHAASIGDAAGARGFAGSFEEEIEQRLRASEDDVRESSRTTAEFALPSALFVALALWLRHRRRRGVADVVEVVERLQPTRARWKRPIFLLLSGIGYTLLVAGFFGAEAALRGSQAPMTIRVYLGAGGAVAMVAGVLILARTRRRTARTAAAALRADGRRPVLYLRSFADDHTSATVDRLPGSWETTVLNLHSREEQLAGALSAFGPVIAVGRPGEPLPYLGAARFYVPDDQWRTEVRRLMELSQLIVLRLGPGEGLWWEVEQARRTQPPRKLVLLVPGEWADLTDRLAEQLGTPLGVIPGGDAWTAAVITFDQDWKAHVYPVAPPDKKKPFMTPAQGVAQTMQAALAAVGLRKRTMTVRVGVRALTNFGRVLLIIPAGVLLIRVGVLLFGDT
jgi:hypothetical protein